MHLMPYLVGDSLRALRLLVLRAFWGIDQNGQCDIDDVVWVMHWHTPKLNGYLWYWTGEYDSKHREIRHRLSASSLNTRIDHRSTQFISRLRTKKRGGRRPYTAATHMRVLAALNAKRRAKGKAEKVWCLEVKGSKRFKHDAPWLYLRGAAIATGILAAIMTLQQTQADSERALIVLTKARDVGGFQVAVLPRARKPKGWPADIAVWGKWRK